MAKEQIDKRKVKQVNGWKVNHPFSAANMFYAFFTLALIAFPVVILFIPLVTIEGLTITGIELFKYYAIDFVKLVTGTSTEFLPPQGLQTIWDALSSSPTTQGLLLTDPSSTPIGDFISIGQAGIIAILMLNSVFALIYFIILICKGYLKHAGHIKAIMVFDFIFSRRFSTPSIASLMMSAAEP